MRRLRWLAMGAALLGMACEWPAEARPRAADPPARGNVLAAPYCGATDEQAVAAPLLPLAAAGRLLSCAQLSELSSLVDPPSNATRRRQQIAEQYGEIRAHFEAVRQQYRQLPRDEALDRAAALLPLALSRAILPLWLGTTWAFSGASDVPGQGSIACGYLVASSLYALGFRMKNRPLPGRRRYFPLATHPAEPVIKRLVARSSITRFSNRPVSEVLNQVRVTGAGVYLVGLDVHVGFLVYDGHGPVRLWHAKPHHQVRLESPEAAPYFADSRYRVLARLDRRTAALWLDGGSIDLPTP